MKTSLHKHSFRTVGLALATALSLAASMHSAQAAIVQITLNRVFTAPSTPIASSTIPVNDVTGQSTASTLYHYSYNDTNLSNGGFSVNLNNGTMMSENAAAYYFINPITNQPDGGSLSGSFEITFNDTRINTNQTTTGYAQAVGAINGSTYSVTLTRVVFDNASTTLPNNFSLSSTSYPEFVASSTAVPEPGTFIPAAVLVAGAILRRRRSRSHRSGRATA